MIVCADDFGMAPDINEAIAELARMGRISAVSVMAALPGVDSSSLKPLLALDQKIDLGLHLVFTDSVSMAGGKPLPSFGRLLAQCWLGALPFGWARNEIAAQYQAFLASAGRPPDFIDGHMHVHQFPIIRRALISFMRDLGKQQPYVRNTHIPLGQIRSLGISPLKAASISLPGGAMKRLLTREGIRTNQEFRGIYDFSMSARYAEFLKTFAESSAAASAILMTHPGKSDHWRKAEYDALLKADWIGAAANRFPRGDAEAL